ncbi:MAG: hypothetical protein KDD59_07340 [Bdellovibrionales bacterium]|nr:hypothetical protein [Bdellovibrionales bacterium]
MRKSLKLFIATPLAFASFQLASAETCLTQSTAEIADQAASISFATPEQKQLFIEILENGRLSKMLDCTSDGIALTQEQVEYAIERFEISRKSAVSAADSIILIKQDELRTAKGKERQTLIDVIELHSREIDRVNSHYDALIALVSK